MLETSIKDEKGKRMEIGIIVGSIREGRLGLQIGEWIKQQADVQGRAADYVLIDLKGFDVPLFTSATHPMMAKKHYDDARVQAWSDAIDACDAFIFVTPEYNHGVPGAFKNAVNSLGSEWVGKTYAVVGYGAVGGVRAIENWRSVLANFSMVNIRNELNINLFTHFADGAFVPNAHQNDEVKALFDALENLTGRLA
ncbi:NADPH-dependent FMN reductase [Propioniciclava flava]